MGLKLNHLVKEASGNWMILWRINIRVEQHKFAMINGLFVQGSWPKYIGTSLPADLSAYKYVEKTQCTQILMSH